jgi:VWFA-related protein
MPAKLTRVPRLGALTPTALACCLLLAALPAAAQDPEGRFGERIEVTEVLLDVVVTDRSGAIVAGLGPDDFVIEEDGAAIPVTGASFYTTRYAAREDARPENEVPASRYFIFFFEDQRRHATPGNRLLRQQLEAAKRSQEWIETEIGPSDWIAVVSYDVKLKVHADFTQDRAALLAAIEEASHGGDPERTRGRREYGTHEDASLLRRLPYGIELRRETARIYDGLRLLAEASGHIVGRKNLVLFSIGFGDVGRAPVALPDRRYYPAMEEALNANNVAVYPIDLMPGGGTHLQSSFLNTLASDTGGSYHHLFTSFTTPLRQIAQEATGYYLLSYRAEHAAGESGYREVKVKTRDKKLRVRAQNGYRYGSEG